MDGFDILLIGIGIAGLLLTGVAVFGKRPALETVPIGAGSLGVVCVGLGGTSDTLWVLILGALLLAGACGLEWQNHRKEKLQQHDAENPEKF